jgi:hypothetical protein
MIPRRPEIRPQVVDYAVAILFMALIVRAVDVVMIGLTHVMSATIMGLTILAVITLVVRKISQGRNWARITYLIYVSYSLQFMDWWLLLDIHHRYNELSSIQALGLVLFALQFWAIFALFSPPGDAWFLKPEKPQEKAAQGSSTASQ